MALVSLADVLQPALKDGYAISGMVCLGWEDMRAYAYAAQEVNCPVILQAGPSCRAHTPLPILSKMMHHLAQEVDVPVVAHLDHGYTFEECKQALDCGFTSLMFDGSRKSLSQNIDETAKIAELAHGAKISCEGEIGFVGYANGENSSGTEPEDAKIFAAQTKVDAMAISVGNVHLRQDQKNGLDEDRISEIQAVTKVPLVIHGGSGVPVSQRQKLAKTTAICKFNIGTQLRMVFGSSLRQALEDDRDEFDRVALLKKVHEPIKQTAIQILKSLN